MTEYVVSRCNLSNNYQVKLQYIFKAILVKWKRE